MDSLIWAVSTVKDTVANLERFVTRNLAGGVDHLVVFVDDDDAGLLELLSSHPHTTGIAAGPWWGLGRPDALNSRQRIAANAVRATAAGLGDVEWVFHIDGDEAIQLDARRLASLGPDARAVRLEVLEAVAEWNPSPGAERLFKRRLAKDDLNELVARGLVDRPRNDHYFNGHVNGKIGVRPAYDVWLGIHRAMDDRRQALPALEAPWLRLLHYATPPGRDFERKWRNLLNSGTRATVRSARTPVADGLRATITAGERMGPDALRRVFEETVADDVPSLRALGVLEEIDPCAVRHAPTPYAAAEELESRLLALSSQDKRAFEPERGAAAGRALVDGYPDKPS